MKRSLFALALAAALPMSAQAAEGLSFTYFEADYVNADVSEFNDMDGFRLHGSAHFSKNWYGTASWSQVSTGDVDYFGFDVDVDFQQSILGIGWHTDMSPNSAFLAEAAWVSDSYELKDNAYPASGDSTYDGWRLTAGLRGNLGERFEGEVRAHWTDLSDVDSGFGGEINGMFKINPTWGITGGWAHDDFGNGGDIDQWRLGVRASF